jgi:short-subunit dehydrogenase
MDKLEGRSIDIFIYNAAVSYIGPFERQSIAEQTQLAQLNMITPLNLAHSIGNQMLNKGKGAVILMASMAGLQGTGHIASYAATKAFDRVLAESLWYEWKNKGVDVLACIAGATITPGYLKSKPAKLKIGGPSLQTADQVVKECFTNLGKRPSFISGRSNRFASFLMQRLFPRKWAVNIIGNTTTKMYGFKN